MRGRTEVGVVAVGRQPQGAKGAEGAEGGKGGEEEGRAGQRFLGAVKELVIAHQHLTNKETGA